jgi:hypothetical protein
MAFATYFNIKSYATFKERVKQRKKIDAAASTARWATISSIIGIVFAFTILLLLYAEGQSKKIVIPHSVSI